MNPCAVDLAESILPTRLLPPQIKAWQVLAWPMLKALMCGSATTNVINNSIVVLTAEVVVKVFFFSE